MEQNGIERNGTGQNGTERDGTDRKELEGRTGRSKAKQSKRKRGFSNKRMGRIPGNTARKPKKANFALKTKNSARSADPIFQLKRPR